jgi:UDP-N-acetylglucosamine--N-acetylmuramyl-(pentapeptide) pyrophosphoryl-undecaprenol N-acetylglucosamine transferase
MPNAEVLWVGGKGGMESGLVERAGIPFKAIAAAQVHGIAFMRLPGNFVSLVRGFFEARRIIAEFKPDAMLFTGGYIAAPLALAGRNIPSLLCVPDIEPGLALQTLTRFAKRIAVPTEESKIFFDPKSDVQVTGYPVRSDLAQWTRDEARRKFAFADIFPTVLIFGGSKGARSINMALLGFLPELLERAQVIHISGALDWPAVEEARNNLPENLAQNYRAFPYLHEEMGAALAAADLVVSRAGASTLGEFPAFGLPAILVPYPHAWRYQKVNADYLAKTGAAIVLEDDRLKSGLWLTLETLLQTPEKLEAMRQAMRALAQPDAAERIADQLCALAGDKPDGQS